MAEDRIKCPICAELIKADAKKCRFCGEWLEGREVAQENGVLEELPGPPESEGEEWYKDGVGQSDWESPEPGKKPVSPSKQKGRRFPWLRIILVLAYVAIIAVLVCSERNAHRILRDAKEKEGGQNFQAAFDSYADIIQLFPFSFSVLEAQRGLQRLSDAHGFTLPRPSWLDPVEDVLGQEPNVCMFCLLPFVVWPACAVLLALVFLTRILRPGTALFVLVLLAIAIAGSLVQLSWYGRILSEPVAKRLSEEPVVLYSVTYALLVVTALMTLTATRKRRSPAKAMKKTTTVG
jgi:hypothetical protein